MLVVDNGTGISVKSVCYAWLIRGGIMSVDWGEAVRGIVASVIVWLVLMLLGWSVL